MLPPIDLSAAALDIGNGLGNGAALGLKITQNAPPPPNASDIPSLAGTLAFGLSRSFTDAFNTSNIGGLIPANFDFGDAALGAGRGLGTGSSIGLGLASNKNVTPPAPRSPSDVAGLAEAFGFGLGNSFTDKINLGSQAQSLGSMMPAFDLGATLLSAGAGLGLGTASGLRLTTKAAAPPPPSSLGDVPRVAGSFAFGLGDALTGALNTTDLLGNLAGGALGGAGSLLSGGFNGLIAKYGGATALGLGKGLGEGAAVGLGLQPLAPPVPLQSMPNGDLSIGGIAEKFGAGLSAGFLANGTAGKALDSLIGSNAAGTGGLSGLTAGLDVPRIANGFARGLLTGAADGVQALGGINAVLNGTSRLPTAPIADSRVDFDDSASGAAVGLGLGLGSSGVVTLQRLLAQGVNTSPVAPATRSAGERRGAGEPTRALALFGRQDGAPVAPAAPAGLNLTNLLSADAVTALAQAGVDVLTCDGVAGLFLMAAGLQSSGTLSLGVTGNTSNSVLDVLKAVIPRGNIRLVSRGNTIEIDGTQLADNLGTSAASLLKAITVNGSSFTAYAAFLVIHVGGAALAFYVLLPIALTLRSLDNMLVRLRVPNVLPAWTPKATKLAWMFGIAPLMLFVLVFGVLSGSRMGHFRTVHGVLGLVSLLAAVAAVVLFFLSKPALLPPGEPIAGSDGPDRLTVASNACNQLLLVLLLPTGITGFADLSSVSLCLTRAVVPFELAATLGLGLGSVFVLGQYVTAAELLMLFVAGRKADRADETGKAAKAKAALYDVTGSGLRDKI